MRLKHVGIRPVYELTLLNWKRCLYVEELPNGKDRIWTKRMLRSGCNEVTNDPLVLTVDVTNEELLYCPYCDEYFAKEQWREETV